MRLHTKYSAEGLDFDSQQGKGICIIFIASKPPSDSIQSPIKIVLGLIPQDKNCRGVKLTNDIHLVLKLRIM
jgi:hypothetical protein